MIFLLQALPSLLCVNFTDMVIVTAWNAQVNRTGEPRILSLNDMVFHDILTPSKLRGDLMGTILGSWSGMRKYLEREMLAESLHGRVQYGCTAYVGMDGCRIFEIRVDGKQFKRFSMETVNTYFISMGLKKDPAGYYWDEFWELYRKYPMQDRTEYDDEEFCNALAVYRNQSIQDSIRAENPLIRMFAILDRRIGKRTLIKIKEAAPHQPDWLNALYQIRLDAEHL